jgi:molecular chaperone IbpA
MTRYTTLNLPHFHKATVGFDRMFDELERTFANSKATSYPPYNIVQINDDEYMISVAVAGFAMSDLDVVKDKNILRIEGTTAESEEEVEYLHKGIGARNFRREFTLADHVEVESASLELGMLNVYLKREVPEELQPKKIEIKTFE